MQTKTKNNEALPKATAKRLPAYYRLFKKLYNDNVERTNSQQIAENLGVDSATVRRDFSYFGELGRRGYGYETKTLRDFFSELLNDGQETNIALVGVGNLGRALIHYRFHERNKMRITQAYDVAGNPLVGTTTDDNIPIYNISDIKKNLANDDIETAILSVQSQHAQEATDILVDAGIKGILNFTPQRLSVPDDVVIQSVDLTSELQTLLFFMKNKD
ncbi:redox-sensing transcriptional repressor Rex [Floricoccus penangensis]|uniref:Redox-sensing transcriptional repressor Rex n=1 Tax=Floricoccus penangensis TaxID=1859475 RepID=A0A9Q5P0C0_9LACT|nr:redox-sensing transcriptional repressor Rex [Floricoccus penangensis]OFI46776.1 redox-sensing transcriptional repressor Rex [Floricoccus penangensis]URZ86728.1 redox-sensing transcriptional repressor Rex [Floricoccus penangensis]